jgi:signal transduction histidine kinase
MAPVVSGTGIGIGAPALRSLGQPFQQADSSIGRKLPALHGGALTIDSAPGYGTTMRAFIPRERIVEATSMERASTPMSALSA